MSRLFTAFFPMFSLSLASNQCMLTGETYEQGARCYDRNNNVIEYRNNPSWCCSEYGQTNGYHWRGTSIWSGMGCQQTDRLYNEGARCVTANGSMPAGIYTVVECCLDHPSYAWRFFARGSALPTGPGMAKAQPLGGNSSDGVDFDWWKVMAIVISAVLIFGFCIAFCCLLAVAMCQRKPTKTQKFANLENVTVGNTHRPTVVKPTPGEAKRPAPMPIHLTMPDLSPNPSGLSTDPNGMTSDDDHSKQEASWQELRAASKNSSVPV